MNVFEKIVHRGDVNLTSGNIRFQGDIDIIGNITDSMVAESKGKMMITGICSKATVNAGHSTIIKGNVFSSNISAGKSNMIVAELAKDLEQINDSLDSILFSIKQIVLATSKRNQEQEKINLTQIMKMLFEQKYKLVIPSLKAFVRKVSRYEHIIDESWLELTKSIYQKFIMISGNGFQNLDELIGLIERMVLQHELASTAPDPDSTITIPYALNSRLYSSGDIYIEGQGLYNCIVQAGRDIKVKGLVRGGQLVSNTFIQVEEVGSDTGVKTSIEVGRNGQIRLGKVYPNTAIHVGNRLHTFNEMSTNVYARLSESGELMIH